MPAIGITKRRLKQLEAIQLIREQRRAGKQNLALNASPFVLCGIPLRQAILKRAFEGKLVPQDPTDEPATVLLERIRAERGKLL